jgi:soluble lytic murein transglycosylase
MFRLCLLLLSISACSSAPQATVAQEEPERELAEDPQFQMARLFDELLQGRMIESQRLRYEQDCAAMPHASVFCFTVSNRKKLMDLTLEVARDAKPKRTLSNPVRPRFNAKNQVLNWNELKTASVGNLLRGLPKKSRSKLQALKIMALRETECPNRVAIAIAACLEDQLPTSASFEEVGRLYEKGGSCNEDSAAERELVLTRAGLMYYAGGHYSFANEVLQKSTQLPGTFVARALYWLSRTKQKLSEPEAAKEPLQLLKTKYPFSFHSLVAMTAEGRDPGELLSRKGNASTKRSKHELDLNLLIEQVEILHRFGFDLSAAMVLNWAVALSKGTTEPEVLLYIAELKREQGDYKSKISILSDVLYQNPGLISRTTMELYFPKVLFPVFEKNALGVDPYFLLAIARRESAFDTKAVSSANARGLLQVLPSTGRRVFRKRPDLFDPDTNIEVGAKYVEELIKKTQGQVHLALASYNAGPGKVAQWTRVYPTEDPILFTDLIPFKETREYVGSVLRNYYWYRRIHQSDTPLPQGKLLELAIAEKD